MDEKSEFSPSVQTWSQNILNTGDDILRQSLPSSERNKSLWYERPTSHQVIIQNQKYQKICLSCVIDDSERLSL